MKARFDNFAIDSQTRQLTRGDEAIHLSPKAFAVLCALIEQRPNVVPKADLFGQIWPDVFVVEGNLNVLVGEIRRALGDDPERASSGRTASALQKATDPIGVHLLRPTRPFLADVEESDVRSLKATRSAGIAVAGGSITRCVAPPRADPDRRCAAGAVRPRRHERRSSKVNVSTAGTARRRRRHQVGSVTVKFREWTDSTSRTKRIPARGPDS